ncbi:MAG: tetratricopeptide repeat protein [Planctomycetia bacterium]
MSKSFLPSLACGVVLFGAAATADAQCYPCPQGGFGPQVRLMPAPTSIVMPRPPAEKPTGIPRNSSRISLNEYIYRRGAVYVVPEPQTPLIYRNEYLALEAERLRLEREIRKLDSENVAYKRLSAESTKSVGAAAVRIDRSRAAVDGGGRLFAAGSYLRAADRFKDAVRLHPDDAAPAFHLVQALVAVKKYVEAADALREGLRRDPDWLDAGFDPKVLYGDPADFDAHLGALALRVRTKAFDRPAVLLLAYQRMLTGDEAGARVMLDRSLQLDEGDAAASRLVDLLDERTGRVRPEAEVAEATAVDEADEPKGFGSDRPRPAAAPRVKLKR